MPLPKRESRHKFNSAILSSHSKNCGDSVFYRKALVMIPDFYSVLNDWAGSVEAARRAGMRAAMQVATARVRVESARTSVFTPLTA